MRTVIPVTHGQKRNAVGDNEHSQRKQNGPVLYFKLVGNIHINTGGKETTPDPAINDNSGEMTRYNLIEVVLVRA